MERARGRDICPTYLWKTLLVKAALENCSLAEETLKDGMWERAVIFVLGVLVVFFYFSFFSHQGN